MLFDFVGSEVFSVAEVEDTLVDVHVSPVGTATLCYAELAPDFVTCFFVKT